MGIDIIRNIFQILGFITICITFIIQIKRLIISRKNLGYRIAIMFWMGHAIVFYIAIFLSTLFPLVFTTHNFTSWSSGLRFHGYVTFAAIELSRYKIDKLAKIEEKNILEELWKIFG